MVTATTASTFLPWFAACTAIWFALFELTARMPIDFRELALETSANIAKRIRSVQRGGFGASAGKASLGSFVRRIPWIFGRGAFGAVAWVKLSSIARKARGTLTVSALIITLVTVASIMLFGEPIPEDTLRGAALVAGFGTLYLCGGLRFDFRTDLDRMEAIKSWPLRPSLVFLANLLPQVLLVTLALSLAIVVRTAVTGGYELLIVPIIGGIPLLTLAWMALDNAVFLFAPVRYVPGQEGMLQHMGRSMLLMLVRVLVGLSAGTVSAVAGWGVWAFTDGLERDVRIASTAACVAAVVLLVDVLLVLVGGVALRRFDVSRIPK